MSGINTCSIYLPYAASCYAMCGTDLAYGGIRWYALSGTDLAYGTMKCAVLTWRMVIRYQWRTWRSCCGTRKSSPLRFKPWTLDPRP
eukprot:3716149-Rhodomonas_salina.1